MKNKHKAWGIGVIIILGILMVISFIVFQSADRENENIKAPIAEEAEPKVVEKEIDNASKVGTESSIEKKDEQLDLTIFTGDIDTFDKKEASSVKADVSLSVTEKLMIIANELSKMQFTNLPIEIQALEQIEGKTIAVINLREKEKKDEQDKTWIQYLNAGSTGSQITLVTLEESFLQRDLEGEWIDGMKIIYEGKDIEVMDHFPETHIIYRVK